MLQQVSEELNSNLASSLVGERGGHPLPIPFPPQRLRRLNLGRLSGPQHQFLATPMVTDGRTEATASFNSQSSYCVSRTIG